MIQAGVKIPRLGYLDPHPIKSAFGKFWRIFYLPVRLFYFQLYLMWISRDLEKLWNFVTSVANYMGGGGQDTPAGVSWLPLKSAFWKFEDFFFYLWSCFIFNCILRGFLGIWPKPMELCYISRQWYRVGVEIPRLGYLDPHPIKSAFEKFWRIFYLPGGLFYFQL